MEQDEYSQPVDPVAEISMVKRELRIACIDGEQLSPRLQAWAMRLELAEQKLEQQPARVAQRIAQLVEQELVRDMMG